MLPRAGRGWLALLVLGGIVMVPVGWVASDAIERNNDFCTACHLDDDVPLHIDIRHDFDARPPASMAALHAARIGEARPEDPAMRCIDCHGGVGLLGKAKIKALAARDALVWLAGRGAEPTEMRHPLVDADCVQCHEDFEPVSDPYGPPPFHELAVHNTDLGMSCVTCHRAHEQGGDPDFYYLDPALVRRSCAHCHAEFEQ